MNELVEQVRRGVETAARSELANRGALSDVEVVGSSRLFYSTGCRLRLRFENGLLDVYVKIYRRSGKGFEEECVGWAREEFLLLQGVSEFARRLGGPPVVRPLLLLPEVPGVAFEYHPGRPLNELLRRRLGFGGRSIQELASLFRGVGEGLRQFHDLTRPGGAGRAHVEWLRPVEWGLDRVLTSTDEMGERAASLCRRSVRAPLERQYAAVRGAFRSAVADDYPRWGLHGDFTPVNVFVHDGDLTLFDFVNFALGHPYEDLSRFLAYIAFLPKDPLSFRAGEVSELCRAFLDGYGIGDDERQGPELAFFFQRSLFRTLGGGIRFQTRPWPLSALYAASMRRVLESRIAAGGGLP